MDWSHKKWRRRTTNWPVGPSSTCSAFRSRAIEMAEEQAAGSSAVGRAVEEVRSALNEHADVVAELFGRVSSELRTGFAPAVDSFIGFFHAVDWKVPPTHSPIYLLSVRGSSLVLRGTNRFVTRRPQIPFMTRLIMFCVKQVPGVAHHVSGIQYPCICFVFNRYIRQPCWCLIGRAPQYPR